MQPSTSRGERHLEALVTDTISLTIPLDDRFRPISSLVLGGLGSRLDFPYERMDDLQLAVLSILDAVEGTEASLHVEADGGSLSVSVGPLRRGSSDDAGLRRVVSRLVDGLDPATRDGAEWLTLRVSRPAEPSP